jgi:hypothetical protein
LGAVRASAIAASPSTTEPEANDHPVVAAGTNLPSRDELTLAWGDHVLDRLGGSAKARFNAGRFVAVEDTAAVFALPNRIHRDRCEELRPQVEEALAAHFGRSVPLRLVVDGDSPAEASRPVAEAEEVEEVVDMAELRDAPSDARSHLDLLSEAFPGSQVVEEG